MPDNNTFNVVCPCLQKKWQLETNLKPPLLNMHACLDIDKRGSRKIVLNGNRSQHHSAPHPLHAPFTVCRYYILGGKSLYSRCIRKRGVLILCMYVRSFHRKMAQGYRDCRAGLCPGRYDNISRQLENATSTPHDNEKKLNPATRQTSPCAP